MSDLIEELQTESDLCRNDGANDIADLLDKAIDRIAEAEIIINHGVSLMTTEQLSKWQGVRAWLETVEEQK